jgi:hypothetical protein
MPSLLANPSSPGQPRSPQAIRQRRGVPGYRLGHPQARWMRRRGFRLCRSLMVLPMILGRLGRTRSARRPGKRPPLGPELISAGLLAALVSQISAIAATPCVPPCVAVSPLAREMSRKAPGRLCGSTASPDRVLVPEHPCFSCGKRAERLAAKTLGTATIPCHGNLPVSVRFADEHPTRSGAPGAPLSLTPSGLTAFLRSRP